MATFEYKALQANGAACEGRVDAGGRQEAMRLIEERGLTPLRLKETATAATTEKPASNKWGFPQSTRVSFEALEDFTRSLSSLLTAAVPLSRALTILYKEASNQAAGAKWRDLHDCVIDGVSLADSMSRSPEVFPRVYVAMVEAGEAGGFLDVVLAQIADFQAQEKELRAKVLAALIYPAVIFNAALPVITQVIIGVSHGIRAYGLYIAAAIVAALYFGKSWLTTEENRRKWEAVLLRLPVVGPLAAKLAMARFCRMLGTLLGAGVPLMNGLNVARRSLGYQTLIDLIADSTERVSKGEPLAAALADCRALFPGSTLEMISVAEESGRLDKELVRLAGTTEVTLDRQLKTAVSLAEPLLLFFIAAVIGVIFVGMVIPIFTIQDYIK